MPTEQARAVRAHAELFDIPDHAVIATTIDGQIVYWSDHATRLFGWERAEVMGRNVVDVTPAPTTMAQAEEIMAALKNGKPWSGEFRMRRRDGSEFDARVRDVPVRNSAGDLIGIIGVTRSGE